MHYDPLTPRWDPLCFPTEGSFVPANKHHPHILPTTTNKKFMAADSIFRNTQTPTCKSCHRALQTISSNTTDAALCWSEVECQKVLPEHNEFSIFDWHFGWRRGDVFLVGGEHGCSVCGGGGVVPLPVWTQHNHTHSALNSVSSSSPASSSSSLQLHRTEQRKKPVRAHSAGGSFRSRTMTGLNHLLRWCLVACIFQSYLLSDMRLRLLTRSKG